MSFMNWIVSRLNDASAWFYELYIEAYYEGWPLSLFAPWFLNLTYVFNYLAWDFSDFGAWVYDTADKLLEILDWNTIWSYIQSYVPDINLIGEWFSYWSVNVGWIVDAWWNTVKFTVQSWIAAAEAFLQGQVNAVNAWLVGMQATVNDIAGRLPSIDAVLAWWSGWTGGVLTVVNTWWTGALLEVQGLIDSAFAVRESFWDGWQDWRDQVAAFFTDPEDWLYKSVDRIVERFW